VLTDIGTPLTGTIGYFDGLSGRWEYIPVHGDPAVAQRVKSEPTEVDEELAVELSDDSDIPDLTDAVLMDVREPDEFETVHIPGAVNIPLSVLKGGVDGEFPEEVEYVADRAAEEGRPLVVYCASGVRSLKAVDLLAGAGIAAVNYPGGITAWLDRQ
jgi:adenylyltransferase/sulfurtransferase